MTLFHSSTLKIAAVSSAIFIVGCGAGAINARYTRARAEAYLLHDAQMAAATFEAAELRKLAGSPADLDSPAYLRTKRRLQELKAADPHARYVYVFRARSPAEVVFLADSTPAGAKDESRSGDLYPEAAQSPGLQSIIRTGKPSMEGPLRDSFGVWVTGYARIGPGETGTGPADLLGIDIAANDWNRDLWLAGIRGALYAWTLLAFPVFGYLTTRRQGQQREAIRNLSEAVEQSHSAIMILDLQHRIEYANRGVCQQLGYGRRELIGRHWRDLIIGPGSATTIADLLATIRTGRSWEGEWTNLRKDGTAYPVHGMVTPVKQRDDTMACFVAIFDDVTELKRKETELREARDLAQAGDKAKSHFLATMSHEVRTPLNGIVGFTTLLLDTPLNEEQREFVQTIRASGEALIQLTGDILDFARIESGNVKLDAAACDPRESIEEALDLHATKAAEKNIVLLHRAAENVPAAVLVDAGRLRQVLVNLVGNAVKFTEGGEVLVTVDALAPDGTPYAPPQYLEGSPAAPSCRLAFSVRDTGIGIPPEMHGRLFKPFSQLDESSTRRYGGAGLGLAICKNLVQLMGGVIEVTSAPGAGTTFTFTLSAPVFAMQAPDRRLDGLRVALGVRPGALRRELVDLMLLWGAEVSQADDLTSVDAKCSDLALVEVSEQLARELVARAAPLPHLAPAKTLALVPISLPSVLRTALRTHFRLLVNLPVHHGPLFALLAGERPISASTSAAAPQFGFCVLVVEDNPVNQRLLQRVLTGFGCTHTIVANGREAISELAKQGERIDVVLLDLHMPEMDGMAALEHIRRGEAGKPGQYVWVIALTADVRPEQRERGFATGLNDYLTKPLRIPDLEAALRRFRSHRQAGNQ